MGPTPRVRTALRLDRLEQLEPVRGEAADDAGLADRDVEPGGPGSCHDDVRDAGQRATCDHSPAVAVEDDERTAVGGAEEPAPSSQRPCGPSLGTSMRAAISTRPQSTTTIEAGSRMFA